MTKAIRSLFACVLFATAVSAVAQAQVRVQVPFDFHVSSKTLSAGAYTIDRANNAQPDVLRIAGNGGSAVLLTVPVNLDPGDSRLLFRRYGDQYFLGSVETASGKYSIPRSREERIAASRSTASEVISGGK